MHNIQVELYIFHKMLYVDKEGRYVIFPFVPYKFSYEHIFEGSRK